MPFTPAHPIYAAPLKLVSRRYVSLTGIILGSMSPDFEYFIALEPYRSIGHSSLGLLLQALPLSIAIAFLFHYIVKKAAVEHLPSLFGLDARFRGLVRQYPWRLRGIRDWVVFILSVVAGFYLHVLLDDFTHQGGHFVLLFETLQQEGIRGIPLYKLLQYGLSLFGLAAELVFLLVLLKKVKPVASAHPVSAKDKLLYWGAAVLIAIAAIIAKLIWSSSGNYIGIAVVSSISGTLLGIVVSSVWRIRHSH